MVGYTNSQSWEAWADSVQVFWDNTEFMFLASVALSLGAVVLTCLKYPKINLCKLSGCKSKLLTGEEDYKDQDVNEENSDKECTNGSVTKFSLGEAESSSHFVTKQLTKEIESQMSEEEKNKEIEARNQQLTAIFKLMKEQEDKFGDPSMDDIKNQMKFYCG